MDRRTYRLQWSEKVVDHLTGIELDDVAAVLDGNLDELLELGLRQAAVPRPPMDPDAAQLTGR
jgi:hypothetical protein